VLCRSLFGDPTVAEPYPDTTSTVNAVAAVCGRLLKETPIPVRDRLTAFSEFVDLELEKSYRPIALSDVKGPAEWVRTRKRPGRWKAELLRDLDRVRGDPLLFSKLQIKEIKGHIKQESYPEFKYPRGIFARQNPNKLLFGPLISAIEDMVYENKQFIKHVPVSKRPAYINDMLSNFRFFCCSDFSSFEGSFSREFQEICELKLFAFCIRSFPEELRSAYWTRFLWCYEKKTITMSIGAVIVKVLGLRMSGEMWTSLANGFSNLTMWKYLCQLKGTTCVGVVEGDDGLFGFMHEHEAPTQADFEALGFVCKIQCVQDLYNASFCGIVFDPVVNVNITDPRPFLASMAWLPYKYKDFKPSKKKALVRAKALSFLYQYPGCPIIQDAALAILRLTSGIGMEWVREKSGFFNAYEEEEFAEVLSGSYKQAVAPIADSTRLLMMHNYNINISMQLELESMFQKLETLQFTYPSHISLILFDSSWRGFALEYAVKPETNLPKIKSYLDAWGVDVLDYNIKDN